MLLFITTNDFNQASFCSEPVPLAPGVEIKFEVKSHWKLENLLLTSFDRSLLGRLATFTLERKINLYESVFQFSIKYLTIISRRVPFGHSIFFM